MLLIRNSNSSIVTHTDRRSRPSVCLFVRSITQKRMSPKCSNLVRYREWSWDILEVTWFWGSKIKGQGHRVNKCNFHNNNYYANVNANLTYSSNTAWVRTLWVPSTSVVVVVIVVTLCWYVEVRSGCSVNNGGCAHECVDDGQSGYFYTCRCHKGFTLQDDGKSCAGQYRPTVVRLSLLSRLTVSYGMICVNFVIPWLPRRRVYLVFVLLMLCWS